MIIDAHQDIAYNMVALGRDYTRPVAQTRALEGPRTRDIATLGLPDALSGGVGLVFATLFVEPAGTTLGPASRGYRTPDEAHTQAQEQLAVYRRLAEHPQVTLVQNRADLAAVQAAWAGGEPQQGIVVLMEGADPIRTPEEASAWQAAGVRLIGPAWRRTRYSGGTAAPGPLTPAGRELMRELRRAGLALDVSHMAEASFWEALELFDGPVVATHANCRALVPERLPDRHLSDEMIRALVTRDAVIGVVLFNRFLDDGWDYGSSKDALGLDAVVRHIDHICQIAGNAHHVAIGSDFDGGFGSEAIPRELDSVADLPRVGEALLRAGWREQEVQALLSGNWLRALQTILP
ncbi:MAG: membrane dipeptidase [Roseiflexaceae bacterium]